MAEQELRGKVLIDGARKAAADLKEIVDVTAEVAEAVVDLRKETAELNATERETAQVQKELSGDSLLERTKNFTIEIGKLALQLFGIVKGLRFLFGPEILKNAGRLTLGTKNLALGFGKVAASVLATSRALRFVYAGTAVLAAGREVLRTLKKEHEERRRLVQIMRIQARAADELKNKQLGQKASLEDIARRRRDGGFAGPDVSRRVQQGADSAKKQFTQLGDEAINQAFGSFGDIEGLSQRDLTDLAIIANAGKLDVGEGRSKGALKRQAERLLARYRGNGQIDEFARTETQQGDGTGRGEFRDGPTERAQRARAEGRSAGGAKGTFKARLAELLPPDFAEKPEGEESSRVDVAAMLYEMYGSARGVEGAKVGVASLRPLTTLINMLRDQVEVGLEDQPGFGSQALGKLGLGKDFQVMRTGDFEEIMKALRRIEADAGAKSITVNVNNQNAKFIGPDAATQRARTRNGNTLKVLREGV